MKIVLANYPPSMISYSTFDAGPKKQAGTSILLQFELVRSGGVEPGTPSFLTERASSLAPSNRLCQQQAPSRDSDDLENGGGCISPRVAARSPGKASSYLYAMKGEARRRRLKCLAPYGIRADPHRESYRFHHRDKYLSQYRSCLREEMNITSTLNQVTGNNLGWKLSKETSSSVLGVVVDGSFVDIISVIGKTLDPAL